MFFSAFLFLSFSLLLLDISRLFSCVFVRAFFLFILSFRSLNGFCLGVWHNTKILVLFLYMKRVPKPIHESSWKVGFFPNCSDSICIWCVLNLHEFHLCYVFCCCCCFLLSFFLPFLSFFLSLFLGISYCLFTWLLFTFCCCLFADLFKCVSIFFFFAECKECGRLYKSIV